jgi:hypothetical protein
MTKGTKIIISIIIIISTVIIYLQYRSNSRLKNSLGLAYASTIGNYLQHINRVEGYLKNEKGLKESELDRYFYEINLLNSTGLPSDYVIAPYMQHIESGLATMRSLAANSTSGEEIERIRLNT